MIFNRKQKYRVRLILIIRSSEGYDEEHNPDGVRYADPKYFHQKYYRELDMPYPPIMGMTFPAYGDWEQSKIVSIRYVENEDITVCKLEDAVYEHDDLMELMPYIKFGLLAHSWKSSGFLMNDVDDPILDSDVEPKPPPGL